MKQWMIVAVLMAALTTAGRAQEQTADGARALTLTAVNLMADDERHQQYVNDGGDPNAVFPGDVIHYRLIFTNVSGVPVQNVEFTDPLPAGLHYVLASAAADRPDVSVDFSIDGGRTYWSQPMVDEIVNGQRVSKPVPPETYTNIRWRVNGWVQPDAQVIAEFRAALPEVTTKGTGR